MYRYGPRFGMPIDPYMAPPMADMKFRGGPQNGPLSQQGGGSMASGSMQRPQQQQGGGMGLGEAAAAAGLLSKLRGPQIESFLNPDFAAQAAQWPVPDLSGAWPEIAMNAGGGGGGLLGSGAGAGAGAGSGGLLGTAATGPEALASEALASGAGAGAGSGGALSLAGPAAAAFAVPGLLNGILGSNIPDPFGELMGLFGL